MLRFAVLAVLALLALAPATSFAHDDGRYGNVDPTIKKWIGALKNKEGTSCCETADGYPAEVEWDTDTGKYRVKIEGEWYVVPDEAVLEEPNRLGYPVVWWWRLTDENGKMTPQIRCFLPGGGV